MANVEVVLEVKVKALEVALLRASYLVYHLVQQIPEFTGVVGPEGQKEDDFIAANLVGESETWKALVALNFASPTIVVNTEGLPIGIATKFNPHGLGEVIVQYFDGSADSALFNELRFLHDPVEALRHLRWVENATYRRDNFVRPEKT